MNCYVISALSFFIGIAAGVLMTLIAIGIYVDGNDYFKGWRK